MPNKNKKSISFTIHEEDAFNKKQPKLPKYIIPNASNTIYVLLN